MPLQYWVRNTFVEVSVEAAGAAWARKLRMANTEGSDSQPPQVPGSSEMDTSGVDSGPVLAFSSRAPRRVFCPVLGCPHGQVGVACGWPAFSAMKEHLNDLLFGSFMRKFRAGT